MTQRVVLINSPPHGEVPFRHIGLASLAAVLADDGIDNALCDLSLDDARAGDDPYADVILHMSRSVGNVTDGIDPLLLMQVLHPDRFDPLLDAAQAIIARVDHHVAELLDSGDVFLFSANVVTYYFAAAMARRLRAGGKRTAVGGPGLWFGPVRDLLLRTRAFDAAIAGEGEAVVCELVGGLRRGDVSGVAGAAWLDGDDVRWNPQTLPPDLAGLPRPVFAADHTRDFIPILASRGCTARCAFCSEPHNWQRARRRDPASVLAEMDWGVETTGTESFHFHDDMINGHLSWFDCLLDGLVERQGRYRWESFCGPNGLDAARLERMRASGCELLKLGVQSFSPATLRAMGRDSDIDHLCAAIVTSEKLGISMHYDMLICFPGETEEAHRQNMRLVEAIFDETDSVYFSLNPFYLAIGSDTHLRAGEYGIRLRNFDPETLPVSLRGMVRACGPIPVGFEYDLSSETIQRRIEQMGAILQAHGRDYLYLGQNEAPAGSGAFQRGSRARGSAARFLPELDGLLDPWRPGEARKDWLLDAVQPITGGEDGLVRYLFRRTGDGNASVAVRLATRTDRPCYARTERFNLFYDIREDDTHDPGALERLLGEVIELVSSNERPA